VCSVGIVPQLDVPTLRTIVETALAAPVSKPGVFARIRDRFTGWFGPGVPIQATAPPGTLPRAYDFPLSQNLNVRPRAEEPVDFPTLRGLADACTICRLAIETRKDQLDRHGWAVRPRDEDIADEAIAKDARIATITPFLQRPDRRRPWKTWLRALLEDLLVIDAPAIYLARTRGGQLAGLELFDGAMIKVLVDITGRPPIPPDPAYRQIVKGLPAVDFTANELLYLPRNQRTNHLYGFSPVEQLLTFVNIAIRRESSQLAYFTDGTLPDALVEAADWTPEQIKAFQLNWDATLTDVTARRKVRFVPKGTITVTKQPPLKDEFDEWIARVVSFAFSLPPTWAAKQGMNRATAQVVQETATDEGLVPIRLWIEDVMDLILELGFDAPDLCFRWGDVRDADPQVQANIHKIQVETGIRSIDEIRTDDLGLGAIGIGNLIQTAQGPILLADLIAGTVGPAADAAVAIEANAVAAEAAASGGANGNGNTNGNGATPGNALAKRATVAGLTRRKRSFSPAERATAPQRARPSGNSRVM
jgi:hypothetical protein